MNRNAELCFEETVRARDGAAADSLKTLYCSRALKSDAQGREHRSRMFHNLGIIQEAKGDMDEAMRSYRRAVRHTRHVDMRNLALAQLAHKLGEYEIALEQYNRLVDSDFAKDRGEVREKIARNRARALESLYESRVASAGA